MSHIRIDTSNILLLVFGLLVLVAGIASFFFGIKPGFWHIIGGGIGMAIVAIFFAIDTLRQKRIIKLSITPSKITLIFNKGKREDIDVKDIESINILVYKGGKRILFPYQIGIFLKENLGFQNYFCVNKSNYDIAFQLYDAFVGIVPSVAIKSEGKNANAIQADINNYIEHKRRTPSLKHFWTSCNKREKFEIFIFFTIILFGFGFVLFLFSL